MKGDIITYSLLESGTFCRALFIICIPKPETLPTTIAVRPIISYHKSSITRSTIGRPQHGERYLFQSRNGPVTQKRRPSSPFLLFELTCLCHTVRGATAPFATRLRMMCSSMFHLSSSSSWWHGIYGSVLGSPPHQQLFFYSFHSSTV
jgi:hypothetical protein